MRRSWWIWMAAAITIVAPDARAQGDALALPELAERTKPSVVLVTVYDSTGRKMGTGSGFFVSSDGRVVTNVHVIDGATRATATLSDSKVIEIAGVLAKNAQADVAVLQAEGAAYPPLPLGDTRTLAPGREVVVIGSPLGLAGTLSDGIVAAVRDGGVGEDWSEHVGSSGWQIQITAPISPGSSGSPVLTRDGRVVAVAVGLYVAGENVNFAVPIEYVRALLDGLPEHATPQPLGGRPRRSEVWQNLGISAAVFAACGAGFVIWSRRSRRRGGAA